MKLTTTITIYTEATKIPTPQYKFLSKDLFDITLQESFLDLMRDIINLIKYLKTFLECDVK